MTLRSTVRWVLAVAMVAMGTGHFLATDNFVRIVPASLPDPTLLVYLSGVAEIMAGLGLLWARTRMLAAYGLIALYIAVFPANVNMALNEIQLTADGTMPTWAMWARLPLQGLIIWIAWWVGQPETRRDSGNRAARTSV